MPSGKANFLTIYKDSSQVYSSASEKIALESPPPIGHKLEDKRVFFITFRPDTQELIVHQLPDEEVQQAELKYPKSRQKELENEQEASDQPTSK